MDEQGVHARVIGTAPDAAAFAAIDNQAGVTQDVQMIGQRGCCMPRSRLQRAHGKAIGASLHEQAEDLEAARMRQCPQTGDCI
jgi:hypothetical protein